MIQSIHSFRRRFDSDVFVFMDVSPEELNTEEDDNVLPLADDMLVPEEMMRKEQSILATPSLWVPLVTSVSTEEQSFPTLVQTTPKPIVETAEGEEENISYSPEPEIQESQTPGNRTLIPSILPFNQHYQLVFFTTVELFGRKVRNPNSRLPSESATEFKEYTKNVRVVSANLLLPSTRVHELKAPP